MGAVLISGCSSMCSSPSSSRTSFSLSDCSLMVRLHYRLYSYHVLTLHLFQLRDRSRRTAWSASRRTRNVLTNSSTSLSCSLLSSTATWATTVRYSSLTSTPAGANWLFVRCRQGCEESAQGGHDAEGVCRVAGSVDAGGV